MRHGRGLRKLNRTSEHRLAMLRNMMNSLIEHEVIKTTVPKAKELRRVIEPMITLGKEPTVANKRLAFDRLRSRDNVTKLFNELGPRYKTRPGGYIPFCVAENALVFDLLKPRMDRARDVARSWLGYQSMIGAPDFRASLAEFMSDAFLGRRVSGDQLAVLSGSGSVLELLFHALADEGDHPHRRGRGRAPRHRGPRPPRRAVAPHRGALPRALRHRVARHLRTIDLANRVVIVTGSREAGQLHGPS